MKKSTIIILVMLFIITFTTSACRPSRQQAKQPLINNTPTEVKEPGGPISTMKLTSPVFEHNQIIPAKYTCDGENISPPLAISDVSERAKSLALIVDDPDAPAGDWVHWTVWNIPIDTKEIPENSVPEGATEGMTDFGKTGYGGPCPPSGAHRYFFKLYALGADLYLDSSATKKEIEKAMEGYVIDKAELIGLYQGQ